MIIRLLSIFLLIFSIEANALTYITSSANSTNITANQPFILTIKADDNLSYSDLEINSLYKDFTVDSKRIAITNINGVASTLWSLTLIAKSGKTTVTVPSFTINGISSKPIVLQVKAMTPSKNGDPIFIKSKLENPKNHYYVDQFIPVEVTVYIGEPVSNLNLNLPDVSTGTIKLLSQGKKTTQTINDTQYSVIRLLYGVTTNRAGKLKIDPFVLSGSTPAHDDPDPLFSNPFSISSNENSIEVLPIPANYKGQWLIADKVSIREKFQTDDNFRVGVPITQEITVSLVNQNPDKLKLPQVEEIPQFNVYQDKATITIINDIPALSNIRTVISFVPKQAGTYTIPEYRVPWWDPNSDSEQFATIPAKTITVLPSLQNLSTSDKTPSESPKDLSVQKPSSSTNTTVATTTNYWIITTAVLAILWLLTIVIFIYIYFKSNNKVNPTSIQNLVKEVKPSLHEVELAIKEQNLSKTLHAITDYLSMIYKKPIALEQIKEISTELDKKLTQLQSVKYAKSDNHNIQLSAMDGDEILNLLKKIVPSKLQRGKVSLSELNP